VANINIKQLEAFVQVADQSSFRRAASSLNTTQPNISARISTLERRLGQKLMERDAGSVRLTPVGVELLKKARGVIIALEDFMVAAEAPGLFEGALRLGVTEMIVHSWLGEYLAALRERFPNVAADLTVDLSSNLSEALFSHSIDLALQSGPFNRQTSGSVDLGSYPLVWVASPNLGVGQRVLTLKTLARYSILTHARQTRPYQQLEKHVAEQRDAAARLVPSTNLSACLRMTLEGLGVACLPKAMVKEEVESGALVLLRYLWVPDDLSFKARFHTDKAPYHVRQAAELAGEISRKGVRSL